MPILVPKGLPAYTILKNENVFVISQQRALQQDIRPLQIVIVNLMPTKEVTETQIDQNAGQHTAPGQSPAFDHGFPRIQEH